MAMADNNQRTLFGHPVGLYTLFFAEMWERFSFYGMRALLLLYMTKGFLKFGDEIAYGIYAAYGAMVYATPFIGGILADQILGPRRAVVLGGSLMAAGHLLMGVEHKWAFFFALALLILGNGFFKPNISTIVGSLYPEGSSKRDGGFTLFYMGINLGAAIAPLLCGYVGEVYGWHMGFGLATIGMLIGLAVFVAPTGLTQAFIVTGALATATGLFRISDNDFQLMVNTITAFALLAAAGVATMALGRGGLPAEAGRPRNPEACSRVSFLGLRNDTTVFLGVLLALPVVTLLLQRNEVATYLLNCFGLAAFVWLATQAMTSRKVERDRLLVVLIMMFFSMLFWAFFEQAGSSINNFTDRNIDRVLEEERELTQADVGKTIEIPATQELLGFPDGRPGSTGQMVNLTELEKIRTTLKEEKKQTIVWTVTSAHIGMDIGGSEIKASMFQAANPIFILIFGLVFTALWDFLGKSGREPSVPFKFSLALLQLGLGFLVLWYGAKHCDERGMVAMNLLVLGYLLHTTGELCLSPVGLSMVTRLSPARIVSTVMGAWFLATSLSHILAGIIAKLTAVSHGEGKEQVIPPPIETVHIYGDVFGKVGIAALIAGVLCMMLVPFLKAWIHADVVSEPEPEEHTEEPTGLSPSP
ncbi:MFS transporter [bacterium CPR1]|nr:MFS transporter [bacterium CPR1]